MSQKGLARRAKVSEGVVSKFFRGRHVWNVNARAIVTALGLKMEDILLSHSETPELPTPLTSEAKRELVKSTKPAARTA